MRMLKKAAIAVVTAGSLSVLGAGAAHADPSVEVNDLKQAQDCTYKALIPVNLNLLAFDSSLGSVNCAQTGSIG